MLYSFPRKTSGMPCCLRSEVVMERTPFLPLPEGMLIDQVQLTETGLRIAVVATHPPSRCPLCSESSSSMHSTYRRCVRDVTCGGRQVQLCLLVRKFFCRNGLCPRKIFTERIPQFVERMSRAYPSGSARPCHPSGSPPVAREGPSSLLVSVCRPRATPSCVAVWSSPIPLLHRWSMWGSTILRFGVASGSERSWWTWRATAS